MERHGRNLFEIVQHVLLNFFNDDVSNRDEFEQIIHEKDLLDNSFELGNRACIENWLCSESQFSSREGYARFAQTLANRRRKKWLSWVAAACVVGGVFGCFLWWKQLMSDGNMSLQGERSFKAILVLNDGKEVCIGDATHHVVVENGGMQIVSQGNIVTYNYVDSIENDIDTAVIYNTIKIPRGGEYELILSDGTHVWLNSESELTYPVRFGERKREVRMEGEVCFDVIKDEQKPFFVKVKDISVQVLGTLFNISAYPEDSVVTATLVRGRINISDAENSHDLLPDQQMIIGDGVFDVKAVFAEEYVRWTEGVFCFFETSLEEIMKKLSRWYDVDVLFVTPTLQKINFSLEIQRYEDVSTVLSKIEKTGRVKFERRGKMIWVKE